MCGRSGGGRGDDLDEGNGGSPNEAGSVTPTPCFCCGSTIIPHFKGPHSFLSNFSPSALPVRYDGDCQYRTVPTLEHAYQAYKARYEGDFGWICAAPSPAIAKARGRRVQAWKDWDNSRLLVMKDLLKEKFAKGSELAERLLSTGDAMLVEGNHWGDRFWGVADGAGDNHLGRLLMEVRGELR